MKLPMKRNIISILLFAIPSLIFAQSGTWQIASSTGLTGRSDFTTAVVGGKIYVIGGRSGTTNISKVDVYDPATDTWISPTVTGTFTPRWGLSSAVVGGKIYVMGGRDNSSQALNTFEVFDPSSNTWTTPATMGSFTGRSSLASAVVGDKIYAIGGYNGAYA